MEVSLLRPADRARHKLGTTSFLPRDRLTTATLATHATLKELPWVTDSYNTQQFIEMDIFISSILML